MAFANEIADRLLQGTPIAPPQQPQQVETPTTEPQKPQITATRITPEDVALEMIGQSAAKYANLMTQTSDDVYQQSYDRARAKGLTMDGARAYARKEASAHQNQRVNALSNAFLRGGIADGTITDQGVQILAQLAQENPQQTKMLGNMYQTPLGATQYAQNIAKMTMDNTQHLQNTLQAQRQQAELRDMLSANEYGRKWDMLTRQQQLEMENKFRTAEIVSQVTGMPIQDVVTQMFGLGGGGGRDGRSGGNGAGRNDGGNNGDWSKDSYKNYIDRKKNFLDAGESVPEGGRNPYENDLFMAALRYAGEMNTDDPASMNFWKDYYMTVKGWTEDQFNQYVEDYSNFANNRQNTIDKNRRLQVNHRGRGIESENSTAQEEEPAPKETYNPNKESETERLLYGGEVPETENEEDETERELTWKDIEEAGPKYFKGKKR